MDMIRLFVGHDPREAMAYNVFVHSVMEHCSEPIAVTPLSLDNLRGIYEELHTDGSNQFIYTRFLVPYLMGYKGWAIFADGDMLCTADIAELWAMRDPSKAVQVVKHQYETKHPVKYLGAKNEDYPCKNWSSVILWNCEHEANKVLTPLVVLAQSGAYLHRFQWLKDELVGDLPFEWNWLVTEYKYNEAAKLVHFTLGTPCFDGYSDCDYAQEWYETLRQMLYVPDAIGHSWLKRGIR